MKKKNKIIILECQKIFLMILISLNFNNLEVVLLSWVLIKNKKKEFLQRTGYFHRMQYLNLIKKQTNLHSTKRRLINLKIMKININTVQDQLCYFLRSLQDLLNLCSYIDQRKQLCLSFLLIQQYIILIRLILVLQYDLILRIWARHVKVVLPKKTKHISLHT